MMRTATCESKLAFDGQSGTADVSELLHALALLNSSLSQHEESKPVDCLAGGSRRLKLQTMSCCKVDATTCSSCALPP